MIYMGLKENVVVGWSFAQVEGYVEVDETIYEIASLHPGYIWDGTTLVAPTVQVYEPHIPTYQELRASEYPPMTDYMDGVVKDDSVQIQNYIDACLAVKAKYPKVA